MGLKAVADARGVIAALVIDQRSALRKLFGKAMNVASDSVPGEKLVQFKETVSRVLTTHASTPYGSSRTRQRAQPISPAPG